MNNRKNSPEDNLKLDAAALRKMDMTLQNLVKMKAADIRADIVRFKRKIARQKKKLKDAGLDEQTPRISFQDVGQKPQRSSPEVFPPRHLTAVIYKPRRPIQIRAVVKFTGNRSDLEAMGIAVRSQAQDIFTIAATQAQLAQLAAQAACQRIRSPRIMYPTVEQASAQAEVADVHNPRPLNPTGFNGSGVLIGIIDSCLDITHNGFRSPTGTHDTRALYYWVQSPHTLDAWGNPATVNNPPGQDPEQFTNANAANRPNFVGLNYGRLYTTADINTALNQASPFGSGNNQICCMPANAEHGTHCAGIAGGSGHEANWPPTQTHIGAAPQATIIFVSLQVLQGALNTGGTFEDAILDGIDFCLRAAQFHNMPIVISVSQVSNFGPHNGSSDFDQARDNFLNSFDRRSLISAAGNDNDTAGYRRGHIAAGNTIETFTMTFRRANNFPAWLDIWYFGPELDYRISYGGNNGGWRTAGQNYTGNVGGRHVEAERDIEHSGGMRGIRIYVSSASVGEIYTIESRNPHATDSVDYHAWAGLQGWWADLSGPTVDEMTLGDTACGRSILTVGACAKVIPPNHATGEPIAAYSGAGPTVDGRIKPEIAAVGGEGANEVMSANSDQASGFVGMNGTSMATPLVAGAVALLYEEYGNLGFVLNQDTIKALLTQHANRLNLHLDPAQAGYVATERNRYGYGRLRLIDAIDEVLPPLDVDVWVRTADDDYGLEPYPGDCYWAAPDIRVSPAGTNAETTDINWGADYDVRVTVRNLGDNNAVGTLVRLKYTRPWTAPNSWFEAEDANNIKQEQTVDVPAMGHTEVLFHWHPEAAEVNAASNEHHFCMLVEVDHAADPLTYPAPTVAGGNAWDTNIKGENNVALRNLHIQ